MNQDKKNNSNKSNKPDKSNKSNLFLSLHPIIQKKKSIIKHQNKTLTTKK